MLARISEKTFDELGIGLFDHFLEHTTKDYYGLELNVLFYIRTKTSNKVLINLPKNEVNMEKSFTILKRVLLQEGDSVSYHALVRNIQQALKELLVFDSSIMANSVLQPLNVYREGNKVALAFDIIVEDKSEYSFSLINDSESRTYFLPISDVTTFSNLTSWSKLLIPTLKLVGGAENNGDTV